MASAGLGLAVMPESLARSLKASFELSLIRLESRNSIFRETVIHVEETRMNQTESALLQHLREFRPQSSAAGR
jgi:DNA-binding transcriptional LysR family regulator